MKKLSVLPTKSLTLVRLQEHGGEVVFQGNHTELQKKPESLTTKYLIGVEKIEVPKHRRKWTILLKF
jgi:excinuclease UvrABC ATPase subunit